MLSLEEMIAMTLCSREENKNTIERSPVNLAISVIASSTRKMKITKSHFKTQVFVALKLYCWIQLLCRFRNVINGKTGLPALP